MANNEQLILTDDEVNTLLKEVKGIARRVMLNPSQVGITGISKIDAKRYEEITKLLHDYDPIQYPNPVKFTKH